MKTMHSFHVEIPDHHYWRSQIKCQHACPVHTDARGYIRAVASGDHELAYLIARGPNPLASICGYVCGAPCELNCRRGSIDRAIGIRAIKRFASERFGPEVWKREGSYFHDWLQKNIYPQLCQGKDEILWYLQRSLKHSHTKRKVAIIGSGPAGLACAHDLALLGMTPVIFELEPVPAGMLYVGVPEYRLPREAILAEVSLIQSLGVEIRCNTEVGKDISFDELQKEYDAIVIAVGAKRSKKLPLTGIQGPGVIGGVDFLRDTALQRPVSLGERVLIIGGGNVAYDISRTVLRQSYFDMARTAVRQSKVKEVYLCCLESLMEMPADDVEIAEGAEEGLILRNSLGPKEILRDAQGKVTGVVFQKVLQVYDENKRFSPKFDPSRLTTIECDNVIMAVGQTLDLSFLDASQHNVKRNDRGFPILDSNTLGSTSPQIFFAGDVASGPGLIIDAVASGKKAARSVYSYLTGHSMEPQILEFHLDNPRYSREKGFERLSRVPVPTLPAEKRFENHNAMVEKGYREAMATQESSRCLDCGINTIFDSEKCVLCGGCAEVCPTLCLKLTSLENLHQNEDLQKISSMLTDQETNTTLSAIIKNEDMCIRCACCANRCPTGAISMERFCFQEKIHE